MNDFLIVLTSALPVAELRGAIPLAVFVFKMELWRAYVFGVIGNLLPVIPLLIFWHFLADKFAAKFHIVHRCREWWFGKVRKNHADKFGALKEIALFVFVAIPLPFTGAWSGTVAAYVFGIPFWKSVIAIGAGVLVSGLIVVFSVGFFV